MRIASRILLPALCALVSLGVVGYAAEPQLQPSEIQSDTSRLAELLGAGENAGFEKALTPQAFQFPGDLGPHESFRNEWWYVTGNLDARSGERFGFELTIFRFALEPGDPATDSAWRSNQVYIAHFAVTDAEDERFFVAQKYSRGAAGLAGATAEPFRVWIDDWQLAEKPAGHWQLTASDPGFAIDVSLEPVKAPVLNGIDGLSQKSTEPGNASFYYSITRLVTEGRVRIGDQVFDVSGLSWLDREWSSSALAADQQGWDWFALQLDDATELMFYNLRKVDGSQDRHSAGTFTDAGGRARHLGREAVSIEVLDHWQSDGGGRYPARWHLSVPGVALELDIRPVLADQELFTTVRYWEGAVDISGSRDGRPVRGRGYVELTGYAESASE